MRFSPYDSSMWTFMEEDSTVEVKEDEWVFHEATRSLLRIHHQESRFFLKFGIFVQKMMGDLGLINLQ